jgi:dihydrofolate synthase/folylpolyglutamate synthase
VVAERPLVVLDGAQNIASIQALKEAVKNNFQFKNSILVLGISKDKDVSGVCAQLEGFADNIVLTKADNPRATEPKSLAKYFNGQPVKIRQSVKAAATLARRLAKKEDLILFTGSLFVVGEARHLFIRNE